MSLGVIIDVAAGLVLMYLLLGLVCTVVNELIARFAGWRAKDLRAGVTGLLEDQNAQHILESVKTHPLMRKVFSEQKSERASYLSSRAFADALIDTLVPGTPAADTGAMKHFGDGVAKLPQGSSVRQTLETLHKEAGKDLDALRSRLAAWYDDTMDRVAGTYKRRIQLVSLGVATLLTVAFNADTGAVAARLWSDEALRTQVAQMGAAMAAATEDPTQNPSYAEATAQLKVFPVGWSNGSAAQFVKWITDESTRETATLWQVLLHLGALLLGWAMTALAVSLGAPFWFEVLQKVNAVRAAGKKPA
jgi:hypothetical protein